MAVRVGVDTGGTFTDLMAWSDDGRVHVQKVPSTPDDNMRAFLEGVTTPMQAGDVVFVKRGVTHAFFAGEAGARAVAITSPGGSESMLRDGAPRKEDDGPPPEVSDADVGALMAAAAGAGLTFLPPDEGGAA